MKDVFEFNHIDKNLAEDQISELKEFTNITIKSFGVSKNLSKNFSHLIKLSLSLALRRCLLEQ